MGQPIHKIRKGSITIDIWKNQIDKEDEKKGSFTTYTIQRSYKDKKDEWQNTGTLRQSDLPKAIVALQQAYELSLEKKEE